MFTLNHKFEEHNAALYAVCWDEKRSLIYTGGSDKIVASWDIENLKNAPFTIKTKSAILNINLISEDLLFIGLFNGDFHVIDLEKKQEVKFLPYHKSGIFSSLFIKEKQQLFVASGDGTISVWNTENFQLISKSKLSNGKIRALHYFDNKIYIGTSEGKIVYTTPENTETFELVTDIQHAIFSIKNHPTKNALIIGDKNAHLSFFHLDQNKIILSLPAHNWPIYQIEIISDQEIATCSRDKIIKIWDANTLEVKQRLCFPEFKGHINSINNLVFVSKLHKLVSVGDDKRICIWNKI